MPGIVSIDHVHCQSKSTTIYHGAYAVNTLKVEIETVKSRKMSFSHSYHNLHRFLVRWLSPQYWTLSLVGWKRCFTCSLLCHFQFLVSFKWFVRFLTIPIDPHYFSSLGTWLTRHLALLHFWPYLSQQMFCYALWFFLKLVISWRVFSL